MNKSFSKSEKEFTILLYSIVGILTLLLIFGNSVNNLNLSKLKTPAEQTIERTK